MASVARLSGVTLHYGKIRALQGVDLDIPSGRLTGLIGPDGVGKSSLMSLLAGSRAIQQGRVDVLGGDMSSAPRRNKVCPGIAYMPQGLGKNLYSPSRRTSSFLAAFSATMRRSGAGESMN